MHTPNKFSPRRVLLSVLILCMKNTLCISETNWSDLDVTCTDIVYNGRTELECFYSNLYITDHSEFYISSYVGGYRQSDDVTQLEFQETEMHLLPSSIFTQLPQLMTLKCVNCHLKELYRSEFHGAKQLEEIDFSHNELKSLEKMLFITAKQLVDINLSFNKIEDIDLHAFDLLVNLKVLNLQNNQLKVIESGVFGSLVSLQDLYLQTNQISGHVSGEQLTINTNLIALNLHENNITSFTIHANQECTNLKTINLASNDVNELLIENEVLDLMLLNVSGNKFENLNLQIKTQKLDASNNKITNCSFKFPHSVSTLKIQLNDLQNFEFIGEMINLKHLDVSQNSNGSHLNLTTLPHLKYLYLENVNLPQINYETFTHQTQLQVLDISYNNLRTIDFNDFSFLSQLQQLFIDGNALTQIDALLDMELFCPSLKLISISNNLFSCQHLRDVIKHLRTLEIDIHVDSNNIVRNQTNFRGISCSNKNPELVINIKNGTGLFPKHLPDHTHIMITNMKSKHDMEIDEIRRSLNATQWDKAQLQADLEIMKNYSQQLQKSMTATLINKTGSENIIPSTTPSQAPTVLNNNDELIRKMDELLKVVQQQTEDKTQSVILKSSNEHAVEAEKLSAFAIDQMGSMAGDLRTLKILITIIFVVGLIFMAGKTLIFYYKIRNAKCLRSSVTMASVMEERI